jgi:hypothetical protein
MATHRLIDVDDTLLIVIDVQAHFLAKLPSEEGRVLCQRICWLIGVACWLGVPLLVTAENAAALGGVDRQLTRMLPEQLAIFDKQTFGLAGDPTILGAIEQTGRRTAVLVGLETDVCVAQSALGLIELGYRVAVVADATGSPGSGHTFGIERMRDAGVIVSSVKGLFYEWLRTVEMEQRFRVERSRTLGTPEGIRL